MKYFLISLTLAVPIVLFGQAINPVETDTTKHVTYSWHSLALRTGVGVQRDFFAEIGPSFVFNQFDSREGFGNLACYATYEWMPSNNIQGVKIGGEWCFNGGLIGVDLKFQSNDKVTDAVITPKYGLGFGFVNLFYGYNFSTNNYPFHSIGKSQFSLVFNLTKKYFTKPPSLNDSNARHTP